MSAIFMLYSLLPLICYCVLGETFLPAKVPSVTVDGEIGSCPSAEVLSQARNDTKQKISESLQDHPYCPCAGSGEWRRIAHLNMRDPSQQCPTNLKLNITTPVRGCGKSSTAPQGCDSTMFSVNNLSYSRVCGRVRGYPKGRAEGFYLFNQGQTTLDSVYVCGISLTHGAAGSREHIWSFVYAYGPDLRLSCPCSNPDSNWPYQIPPFVGDSYFCESGLDPPIYSDYHPNDPLWDGKGCDSPSTCCQFNTPPWFCTTLPQSTAEDIELRLCYNGRHEDVAIDLIDIYVM